MSICEGERERLLQVRLRSPTATSCLEGTSEHGHPSGVFMPLPCLLASWCYQPRNEVTSGTLLGSPWGVYPIGLVCGHKTTQTYYLI